jgi:hypothetical protein
MVRETVAVAGYLHPGVEEPAVYKKTIRQEDPEIIQAVYEDLQEIALLQTAEKAGEKESPAIHARHQLKKELLREEKAILGEVQVKEVRENIQTHTNQNQGVAATILIILPKNHIHRRAVLHLQDLTHLPADHPRRDPAAEAEGAAVEVLPEGDKIK